MCASCIFPSESELLVQGRYPACTVTELVNSIFSPSHTIASQLSLPWACLWLFMACSQRYPAFLTLWFRANSLSLRDALMHTQTHSCTLTHTHTPAHSDTLRYTSTVTCTHTPSDTLKTTLLHTCTQAYLCACICMWAYVCVIVSVTEHVSECAWVHVSVCGQTVEKRDWWLQLMDRDKNLQHHFGLHTWLFLRPGMLVGFFLLLAHWDLF